MGIFKKLLGLEHINFENDPTGVDIWAGFSNEKNSSEILKQKAEALSRVFIAATSDYLKRVVVAPSGLEIPTKATTEFFVMFIYYTEKISSRLLENKDSEYFMGNLINIIGNKRIILLKNLGQHDEASNSSFVEIYNHGKVLYDTNLKSLDGTIDEIKVNLVDEFGVKISKILEDEEVEYFNEQRIFIIGTLENFQLEGLLRTGDSEYEQVTSPVQVSDEKTNIWDDIQDVDTVYKDLRNHICILAGFQLERLKKELQLNEDSVIREVNMEYLVFYLHWVDREAYLRLGPEGRANFMYRLTSSILGSITEQLYVDLRPAFEIDLIKKYNKRQLVYSTYRLTEEEADTGGIFMELSKCVAEAMNEENVLLVSLQVMPMVYSLNTLQLDKLFERWLLLEKN